jgi:predicted GNAT family N-acyltransferase
LQAVLKEYQGKQIGTQLVNRLLNRIRHDFPNNSKVTLHARQGAIPFYEKLGFIVHGHSFEEVGIEHRHMSLSL